MNAHLRSLKPPLVADGPGREEACDCSPATAAQLFSPSAVALDAHGNLFIADSDNNRVRKVIGVAAPSTPQVSVAVETTGELPRAYTLEAYPNPLNAAVSIVFALPEQTELSLRVFNPLRQPVRTLETQNHPEVFGRKQLRKTGDIEREYPLHEAGQREYEAWLRSKGSEAPSH